MTDIDPELAEAIVPETAVPVPEDVVPNAANVPARRQQSTMGVAGIESVLEKAMNDRNMDQQTRDVVSGCVKAIDRDSDGRIDHWELANFAINLSKQVHKLKKKNFSLKVWFQIVVGACLLLVLSTFASSAAAVFMAKDMRVDNGALVTKDNQAIKTTTNEVEATVGALAFLPDEARKHVKSVTFRGDGSDGDEVVYEKLVGSIVVHPRESVVLTTTEGDTLKWSLADNKDGIEITLADGESWMMDSGCEKCTILNLLQDEEVTQALDEYHETIGTVLHERGRVLRRGRVCGNIFQQLHNDRTTVSCELPISYKDYFKSANGKIKASIQTQVAELTGQNYNAALTKLKDVGIDINVDNYLKMVFAEVDKLFNGVDELLDGASDQAVDIGNKFKTNLESVGGSVSLNLNCRTDGNKWTMGLKLTGRLPSLASTLNKLGVGTKLPILPSPLPEIDIRELPTATVDYELDIPTLTLDKSPNIAESEKHVTMLSSHVKILTRLEAAMSECVDLSEFLFSGQVNLKGSFVTEALFGFVMSPQYGTLADGAWSYSGGGGSVTPPSGGYNAGFVLPMPKYATPVTFTDRSIAFRVTDNNMFDATATPCVMYEFEGCENYACSSYWCNKDMCDYIFSLSTVLNRAFSTTCEASTLQPPGPPAEDVCT